MRRARGRWLGLAAGAALAVALLFGGGDAEAHGKQVTIAVTCAAPDLGRPLTRVCTAFLRYLDGDPVTRADLRLTAAREGRAELPVGPVQFQPLAQAGLYSASVTFPAYGRWRMTFVVHEPDSGEAELDEEILPPVPGAGADIRARLQVTLAFGPADVRNIALRIVHLLAATAWVTLSAVVLVICRVVPTEQRWRLLPRLARAFPWGAGGTLLVLAASGALSARYNVPTRPPGLFAPEVLTRLPFGGAYLTVFFIKMALAAAGLGITIMLIFKLRRACMSKMPIAADDVGTISAYEPYLSSIVRWTAVNLLLDLLIFADVVILGYLHVISHVGAAAGAG